MRCDLLKYNALVISTDVVIKMALTFRRIKPILHVVKYKKQLFLQIIFTNFQDNQEMKITEGKIGKVRFLKWSK